MWLGWLGFGDTDVTDHSAAVLCVGCQQLAGNKIKPTSQSHKINYNKLNNILRKIDWKDVFLNSNSVSDSFYEFITVLNSCINQAQREKTKWEKKQRKLKPWMTNSLLKLVKKKNFLYATTKKEPNNKIKKVEY